MTSQEPSRRSFAAALAAAFAFTLVTIESLVKQGTRFVICSMATRGLAGSIASETGGDGDAIYKELVSNAIPNSRMVAAGVLAVNRAQEYGYTLLTAL